MIKFESNDNDISILEFDWFITDLCNYKCPYCLTLAKGTVSRNAAHLVIGSLSKFNRKFKISLLGGEPTLHPLLNYFILNLIKIENCVEVQVITNGSTKLNLPISDKLRILMSYHPTEAGCGDMIRRNIKWCVDNNVSFTLTYLMLKKFENYIKDITDFVLKHSTKDSLDPTYIISNNRVICNKEDYIESYRINDTPISAYDVYSKKLNRFKGWKCWIVNFSIVGCYVINPCLDFNMHISTALDKIPTTPIICKEDECIIDSHLAQLKERV